MLQHLWTGPISNAPVEIIQGSKSVEVRPVGVTKGATMRTICTAMAEMCGAPAVAFDLVLCIGHLLARDENIYSYFEGHKIDGNQSRSDARMQQQAMQMQHLASMSGGGAAGGLGGSTGGAGGAEDPLWRQGTGGSGMQGLPGGGRGGAPDGLPLDPRSFTRRSLDSHPLYPYNRPGSGGSLFGIPPGGAGYPGTRAQQQQQEMQRRVLSPVLEGGMLARTLSRGGSQELPSELGSTPDPAWTPFSLHSQQQPQHRRSLSRDSPGAAGPGAAAAAAAGDDMINPGLLSMYTSEDVLPSSNLVSESHAAAAAAQGSPAPPADGSGTMGTGTVNSGAKPPLAASGLTAALNAVEQQGQQGQQGQGQQAQGQQAQQQAPGTTSRASSGSASLGLELSRSMGTEGGLTGSNKPPPGPAFPPRYLFSCCVGRSRSKARYSLGASSEVADLLEALVALMQQEELEAQLLHVQRQQQAQQRQDAQRALQEQQQAQQQEQQQQVQQVEQVQQQQAQLEGYH
jgi:hypothetical protein